MNSPESQAQQHTPRAGCLGPILYAILLVAGVIIFASFFLDPLREIARSSKWVEVPCTIRKSEVGQAGPQDSYKPEITYSYRYSGQMHRSNRVWVLKQGSDTLADIKTLVGRYPAGSTRTCYVNPDNPSEAMLERGMKPALLVAFIPLALALAGLTGLLARAWRLLFPPRAASVVRLSSQQPSGLPPLPAHPGPVRRTLRHGALPLLVCLALTLLWNGVVYFLFREVINNWRNDPTSQWRAPSPYGWLLTLFSIPFILVGLVLLLLSIHLARRLLRPQPTLSLNAAAIPLGDTLEVSWHFSGNTSRIQRMRLFVEGREEATFFRGDQALSQYEVFRTFILQDTSRPDDARDGRRRLELPPDAPSSFESRHNRLYWVVRIQADIGRWPGVDEELEIIVLPAPDRAFDSSPAPSEPATRTT